MAEDQGAVAPVTKAARVESLDILRGIAVFGILAMNITAFGLLFQAYGNPTVDGGAEGINLTVYKIINVGFEGTMRGIFSLLFGAGIVLLTRRMEERGLAPLGFVTNDYALAVWGLRPVEDPAALLSADILAHEFVSWVEDSYLLRRAFREVAVISGLVERQHPGKRKSGRQVTFSTDLIYDVLRKYEPDHVLIEAAWADARARMTDVGRLAGLLDRAEGQLRHVVLDRVSPLAVPLMVMIGRESMPQGQADDELLFEAESLACAAMRIDPLMPED